MPREDDADALSLGTLAAVGAGCGTTAAAALALRLANGAWPWATPAGRRRYPRPCRDRARRALATAGLTCGGTPHLPTIRAAAAVTLATIGRQEVC